MKEDVKPIVRVHIESHIRPAISMGFRPYLKQISKYHIKLPVFDFVRRKSSTYLSDKTPKSKRHPPKERAYAEISHCSSDDRMLNSSCTLDSEIFIPVINTLSMNIAPAETNNIKAPLNDESFLVSGSVDSFRLCSSTGSL